MPRIWRTKNATIGNKDSCFTHHSKGHLISLTFIWNLININNSLFTTSFVGSMVLANISKMSNLLSSLVYIFAIGPNSTIGWRMWWHLKNIGNKDHWSYSSTMETTCSWRIRDEINFKLLNLGSNIRENMLCVLFPSYFF